MDTLTRLKQLMKQKKMSTYKLAQESGLPLSTITSLFRKGNCPTIPTLETLCSGLGISLSEFFYYEPGDEIPNDEETKQLLAKWNMLSLMEKKVIFDVINIVIDDENSKENL